MVLSIYGSIASELHQLSRGPWLMTGYTLGYCVALPVVRPLISTMIHLIHMYADNSLL